MGIVLYYLKVSPPVRAVLLTIKALGLDVELKEVNLLEEAHLSPEFMKMNPQHTIPTLDDNGFVVWDSHAINAYLVTKYGKDDSLYPKDPQKRAMVDQRLHFDSGILFPRIRGIVFPILYLGGKSIPEEKKQDVLEAYELLNGIIGQNKWVAGDQLTIADFCCVASVSSLDFIVPDELQKYQSAWNWYQKCQKEIKGYKEANQEGIDLFSTMFKSKLSPK